MDKFAFLVHPRVSAREDMGKVFWPLGLVPDSILERTIKYLPPIARGRVTYPASKEVAGWIIIVPLTGPQFYSLPREFVFGKIIQAVRKAEELGVGVVGLGALISSITHGGKDLVGEVNGMRITNGNSLTASLTVEAVKKAAIMKGINLQEARIAVVGATGSIGAAVSLFLAEEGCSLILAARGIARLRNLRARILSLFPHAEVKISNGMADVRKAGVVIVVTSDIKQVLRPDDLKKGALVYDDTQPRNTSPTLLKLKKDVTIIDGGVVSTPGVDYRLNIGLRKEQAYACLAETMLLALEGKDGNYVGDVVLEQAREMLGAMKRHDQCFRLAPFQSFGVPGGVCKG